MAVPVDERRLELLKVTTSQMKKMTYRTMAGKARRRMACDCMITEILAAGYFW